jgi:DNA (cytosine-5)-methyltransferase 3A
MKILSLFDGISIAQQAFKELGFEVEYYASEIDKYALQVTKKNFPKTIQLGDVKKVYGRESCLVDDSGIYNEPGALIRIDLLIGGSPCQDLSIAKKNRKGLDGVRSGLFWEYVRILKEVKPKYFVLENVNSMPKEAKQLITETLGVEPIMINAALVSGQSRKRLFWTNILNVTQPEDRGILLKDILEKNVEEKYFTTMDFTKRFDYTIHEMPFEKKGQALRATDYKGTHNIVRIGQIGKGGQGDRIYSVDGKSTALDALTGGRGAKTGLYHTDGTKTRKLTPIECERLQSLPDNYTEGISNTQRYKTLGNGFNCAVIKHSIKSIL